MTGRRTHASRLVIMLWAVLNMALPSATAIIDAVAGGGSAPRSHVEENGDRCARVHADDCELCQFLSVATGDLPSPRTECVVIEAQAVISTVERRCAAPSCDLARSRAPPLG